MKVTVNVRREKRLVRTDNGPGLTPAADVLRPEGADSPLTTNIDWWQVNYFWAGIPARPVEFSPTGPEVRSGKTPGLAYPDRGTKIDPAPVGGGFTSAVVATQPGVATFEVALDTRAIFNLIPSYRRGETPQSAVQTALEALADEAGQTLEISWSPDRDFLAWGQTGWALPDHLGSTRVNAGYILSLAGRAAVYVAGDHGRSAYIIVSTAEDTPATMRWQPPVKVAPARWEAVIAAACREARRGPLDGDIKSAVRGELPGYHWQLAGDWPDEPHQKDAGVAAVPLWVPDWGRFCRPLSESAYLVATLARDGLYSGELDAGLLF